MKILCSNPGCQVCISPLVRLAPGLGDNGRSRLTLPFPASVHGVSTPHDHATNRSYLWLPGDWSAYSGIFGLVYDAMIFHNSVSCPSVVGLVPPTFDMILNNRKVWGTSP